MLGVGKDVPQAVRDLFALASNENEVDFVREAYGRLGSAIVDLTRLQRAAQQSGPEPGNIPHSLEEHSELGATLEQLSDRHRHLTHMYDDLSQAHDRLTSIYDDLQERHKHLDEMYQASERARSQSAELQAALQSEQTVTESKAAHASLSKAYSKLQDSHRTLHSEHKILLKRNYRTEAVLGHLQSTLDNSQEEASRAAGETVQLSTELAAVVAQSKSQDIRLAESDQALTEARLRITSLEHSLINLQVQSAELRQQLTYALLQVADQELARETLHNELARKVGEVNALVGSASWRVTEPMRDFARHIPQVVRSVTYKLLKFKRGDALTLYRSWQLLSTSPLFQEQYYLENNSDVNREHQDPILHYILHGGFEGRNPHPLFHSSWYLKNNPDVAKTGVNPLVHFLLWGAKEQRNPCEVFDSAFYLGHHLDAKASVNPLLHYLEKGAAEARDPHPCFNTDRYIKANPTLLTSGMNPLIHYVRSKHFEEQLSKSGLLEHGEIMHESSLQASPIRDAELTAVLKTTVSIPKTYWRVSEEVAPEFTAQESEQSLEALRVAVTSLNDSSVALPSETDSIIPECSDNAPSSFSSQARPRIVIISGEADTPGHKYRVEHLATALPPAFFNVTVITNTELDKRVNEVAGSALVWIWRSRWSDQIGTAIAHARQSGARIIFDVDDLMFRPELAKAYLIDGIRTQNLTEDHVREFYAAVQAVLGHADHCTAPTATLARELRDLWKPATIIPNGFDKDVLLKSRRAVIERKQQRLQEKDKAIRIGYAAGT